MKRFTVAAALTVALTLFTPVPVEAHSIRCAAYVGNPCYQHAVWHDWWHRVLANPLGVLL